MREMTKSRLDFHLLFFIFFSKKEKRKEPESQIFFYLFWMQTFKNFSSSSFFFFSSKFIIAGFFEQRFITLEFSDLKEKNSLLYLTFYLASSPSLSFQRFDFPSSFSFLPRSFFPSVLTEEVLFLSLKEREKKVFQTKFSSLIFLRNILFLRTH